MKRKTKIIILLLILCTYFYLAGNPYKKHHIEQETLNYLATKGYSTEQIKLIKGHYEFMKKHGYYCSIIFSDEPSVRYFYAKNNTGQIYQSGMSGKGASFKHSE